ncbi:MAG: nudC [Gemmatimonadetes bacterium]|nr:nudC [Gemmatimonadota bacterium]
MGMGMSHEAEGAGAIYFAFRGRNLLVLTDSVAGPRLPDEAGWTALALAPLRINEVGEGLSVRGMVVELAESVEAPAGAAFHGLRGLHGVLDDELYRMAGRAVQVMEWDRSHLFCSRCGTAAERVEGELAKRCPACGKTDYPRITPAVIVRIESGDGSRVLLARGPQFAPGVYSTIAGFVEPGESLEEAVAREVREEVGVEVAEIRYFGSQPWPYPHSLMVGFTARYAGGELRLQESEVEDAKWFGVDDMPLVSPPLSIARVLIDDWVRSRGGDPATLRAFDGSGIRRPE